MKELIVRMPVTITLITINVVVFIITVLFPDTIYFLAMYVPSMMKGMFWTPFTSMFVHSGIAHIAMNMLSLWFLGSVIEPFLGKVRFLILYMVSGLFGSLCSILFEFAFPGNALYLGASGAIFGLFAAYGIMVAMFYWEEKKTGTDSARLQSLRSGLVSFVVLLIINIGFSMTPGIGWQAHLGGFISGGFLSILMVRSAMSSLNQ